MESQPQSPEFRTNPENLHPCKSSCYTFMPLAQAGLHLCFHMQHSGFRGRRIIDFFLFFFCGKSCQKKRKNSIFLKENFIMS